LEADGPADDARRQAVEASSRSPQSSGAWDVGAETGVLVRGSAIDPLVSVGAHVRARRWGVRVNFALIDASETLLRATEFTAAAGPSVRSEWSGLSLEASLRAGVSVHTYRLQASPQNEAATGTRIDPLVDLPITLGFQLTSWLAIQATLTPGLAGQSRRHVVAGIERWRRDAFRFGATVGLNIGRL
ncbi:MAG: hypothetical protein AAFN74_19945, partial [Myxococcota bacterium]